MTKYPARAVVERLWKAYSDSRYAPHRVVVLVGAPDAIDEVARGLLLKEMAEFKTGKFFLIGHTGMRIYSPKRLIDDLVHQRMVMLHRFDEHSAHVANLQLYLEAPTYACHEFVKTRMNNSHDTAQSTLSSTATDQGEPIPGFCVLTCSSIADDVVKLSTVDCIHVV